MLSFCWCDWHSRHDGRCRELPPSLCGEVCMYVCVYVWDFQQQPNWLFRFGAACACTCVRACYYHLLNVHACMRATNNLKLIVSVDSLACFLLHMCGYVCACMCVKLCTGERVFACMCACTCIYLPADAHACMVSACFIFFEMVCVCAWMGHATTYAHMHACIAGLLPGLNTHTYTTRVTRSGLTGS